MDSALLMWFVPVLLLGLIVGSFLNVCIYRLPRGESIVYPGSQCPHCGTPLKWYHNVPVLSFILLRGRCSYCREPISPVYPLVELSMGALSVALLIRFGLSVSFAFFFLFTASLLVITFIDMKERIIPDIISIPGIAVGIIFSFIRVDLSFLDSIIGVVAGGGSLLLVSLGYQALTKREGMGMGDVKLMAMIGAFLGWQAVLFVILASSFLGAVLGISIMFIKGQDFKLAIPFGPFLAIGAMLYLFWGSALIDWYLGLLHSFR